MSDIEEPCIEEEDTFSRIVKAEKVKRLNKDFTPSMLDYGLDNKTTMRFEYIKSIEDIEERIEAMAVLLKEVMNQPFPDEFYPWIARDMLNVKYTKNQINDMKRNYRIKKRREQKKAKGKAKKNNGNKCRKKHQSLKVVKSDEPFILTFD